MTVEAAIAVTAIVIAVALCLGALLAVSAQIRCVDAAREAARLTARGDRVDAIAAARRTAPPAADITVRTEGDRVIALVSAHTRLLPLLVLRAEAVAAIEPEAIT
ncbi:MULTISPECIES: TadE family type IV pilus minor pilin [unclassified Nocardia]|uniref:TadE family type IV pilus minor pilin n=1 Tax=unclassified Nocardia TaxID=2637762 RepID=UPI001CE3F630|nr:MULTISPECIES: TadE family type IV pilus minor pilin [unclassified Nocardia]